MNAKVNKIETQYTVSRSYTMIMFANVTFIYSYNYSKFTITFFLEIIKWLSDVFAENLLSKINLASPINQGKHHTDTYTYSYICSKIKVNFFSI